MEVIIIQLKLGTVVKSSHTETYVRPTPTYTAFVQHERTHAHGKYHQHYERAQFVCDYLGKR
jgi:hypothetical protein